MNIRHEIIGYKARDPFEVLAKIENAVIGMKMCEAIIIRSLNLRNK